MSLPAGSEMSHPKQHQNTSLTEHPFAATFLPVASHVLSITMTGLASALTFGVLLGLLERSFKYYHPEPLWGEVSAICSAVADIDGSGAAGPLGHISAIRLRIHRNHRSLTYAAAQGGLGEFYVVVLTGAGILGFSSAYSIRDWLLYRPLSWWRPSTLVPQSPWRYLARQTLIPLCYALAAAVIYASSEAIRLNNLRPL